jgi:hypothetical protein
VLQLLLLLLLSPGCCCRVHVLAAGVAAAAAAELVSAGAFGSAAVCTELVLPVVLLHLKEGGLKPAFNVQSMVNH